MSAPFATPGGRVAARLAFAVCVLSALLGLAAPLASADVGVRIDRDPNDPAAATTISLVGDSGNDDVAVLVRDFDASTDPAGYGSPTTYDIVEIMRVGGTAAITRTASGVADEPSYSWCADAPGKVLCAIEPGTPSVHIDANLGDGNDGFQVSLADRPTSADVDGGPGADFLAGTGGNDTLTGGPGFDNLFGTGGDDTLNAVDGAADNTLSCGADNDVINVDAVDAPNSGECETVNTTANPVTLQFAFGSTSKAEGGGQIIPISEATPSTGSGSFRVAVVGGTATKNVDYDGAFDGQVITYDNASTSFAFTLSTLQDSEHEGDETIELALTHATGDVEFGSPLTFSLTITDDDAPGGGSGPTPTPTPGPTGTLAGALPSAPSVLPTVPTIEKRLPDFTRGGQFLIPACKKRGYCDANDVRSWFQLEGTSPAITIKTTSSTNDAPDPKKVVQGEVVGSTPRDGDRVAMPVGGTFPVEVQVFDPKPPKKEQKCKSSQKISAGADTSLGKYLVGKTLEETKQTLLAFDCFSKAGQDEKNVEYAITTTVRTGTRYAEVEKVSDKRIDGSDQTTLVVAMRVPPSALVLTVGPDPTKPGLGLALADGTLTVDPDTKVGLLVRVGLPGSAAPAPVGTEVTLRDPDGQLVDRALTDGAGEAKVSGLIPESKRYELYASFADADGDALAGSLQLDAKKRSGAFPTLSGLRVTAGSGGAKAKPLSLDATRSQAIVLCQGKTTRPSNAQLAQVAAAAEDYLCKYAFESNDQDASSLLRRFALKFPSTTFEKVKRASAKLGYLAIGDFDEAAKFGFTATYVATGNTDGKLVPSVKPQLASVPVVATDGQKLLGLRANATKITDGVLAFRDSVEDVTFVSDGRVIIDGSSSEISPQRAIVEKPALVAGLKPNFSILPPAAAFPGLSQLLANDGASLIANDGASLIGNDGAGIVASGGGNIVASGGGNIVAGGAGNIVAGGAGNIVAGGAGNMIDANGKLINGASGSIVAGGAGNIVAGGAGNIVAGGAGNIVAGGAGNLVAPTLPQVISGLIGNDGAGIIAGGAGN